MISSPLPALSVAVPLLAAAVLAGTQFVSRRLIGEAVALAAALAASVLCALDLALAIRHGVAVYWFGGWQPHHGVALGISFAVDPFGAGLACFVGVLTVAALLFSWRHFESVGHAFPALMLVFMAAMMGFCLSGDLFNMFVFFELMTVTAIALTAHRSDTRAPLQGALNFGITNSVGGFLVLIGITLLYGRTGALNLAQLGVALSHHAPDALVAVAFGLLVVGFFVKAAIIPFHFWLADAYASAPTPVCVLFAGVMSELGLYAVARLYWTVFSGPLSQDAHTLRLILVIAGTITALGGAAMCLLQSHLKRMLAFATISYMGLFLIGIGLLSSAGLAGTAVYIVADGLLKASLFICVGILQYRVTDANSLRIRGLGRGMRFTGLVFGLGALGLAAVPGSGTFLAKSMIDDAAGRLGGLHWVPVVFTLTEVLIGAAAFSAIARVFLGWGPVTGSDTSEGAEDSQDASSDQTDTSSDRTPAVLFVPALALLLGSLAIGIVPGVSGLALSGARRFVAHSAYIATVLGGPAARLPVAPTSRPATLEEILLGLVFTAVAVVAGMLVLHRGRSASLPGRVARVARRVATGLHELHSGHPGDYVAWVTVGALIFTTAFVLMIG